MSSSKHSKQVIRVPPIQYQELLQSICNSLTKENMETIHFFLRYQVPSDMISDQRDFVNYLEQRGLLSQYNVRYIAQVLCVIHRYDILQLIPCINDVSHFGHCLEPGPLFSIYRAHLAMIQYQLNEEDIVSFRQACAECMDTRDIERAGTVVAILRILEEQNIISEVKLDKLIDILSRVKNTVPLSWFQQLSEGDSIIAPVAEEVFFEEDVVIKKSFKVIKKSFNGASADETSSKHVTEQQKTVIPASPNNDLSPSQHTPSSSDQTDNVANECDQSPQYPSEANPLRSIEERLITQPQQLQTPKQQMEIMKDWLSEDLEAFAQLEIFFKSDKAANEKRYETERGGKCYIFNQQKYRPEAFPEGTCPEDREGSNIDASNLKYLFRGLGSKVSLYNDLTVQQMCQTLQNIARTNHSSIDYFVLIILSHGSSGSIYAADGKISIKYICDFLDGNHCKTLAGKAKIIIIGACRGSGIMPLANVFDENSQSHKRPGSSSHDGDDDSSLSRGNYIPTQRDFYMIYSTADGFKSYRSNKGSLFVHELVRNVKRSYKYQCIDSTMTNVKREVSAYIILDKETGDFTMQLPCSGGTLIKKFYFSHNKVEESSLNKIRDVPFTDHPDKIL